MKSVRQTSTEGNSNFERNSDASPAISVTCHSSHCDKGQWYIDVDIAFLLVVESDCAAVAKSKHNIESLVTLTLPFEEHDDIFLDFAKS